MGVSAFGGRGAETSGESLSAVKRLPNFFASTRSRNFVGTGVPALSAKNSCSESGTVRRSILRVPTAALAKTARAPSRLKTTVFLSRPMRKLRPLIVSFSPTPTSIGETLVITGAFFFVAACAGATSTAKTVAARATSAASQAARREWGRMRARSSISPDIGGCRSEA